MVALKLAEHAFLTKKLGTPPVLLLDDMFDKLDPERVRRLLLHKKELLELAGADLAKGLTLVPLTWYNKGKVLKLSFALARGKKQRDKRENIKERETKRTIERTMKQR